MRAQRASVSLWLLLAIAGCHSDKQDANEPSSGDETSQGAEDPVYDTPDGTIGPNAGGGLPPPVSEGMGPGSEGPGDIVDGPEDVPGTAGAGGAGGVGGVVR
jgi:hypothetical protein